MGECCRAGFVNQHWCTVTFASSSRPADALRRGAASAAYRRQAKGRHQGGRAAAHRHPLDINVP
eukprot:3902610-Pyramimonas_sp.AAC.1